MVKRKIKKAIIPAAGLGTRFLPATISLPKEMLIVYDKPVIQYIVEEASAAGIDEVLIIIRSYKEAILNHFDPSFELVSVLRKKKKKEELEILKNISKLAKIHYIRQPKQKGLADAIYQGKNFVGDEPFAVLLGDTIIDSPEVGFDLKNLVKIYEKTGKSGVAIEYLEDKHEVKKYGIVDIKKPGQAINGTHYYQVKGLVEKPKVEEAPSRFSIACRYVFTPDIFPLIKKTKPGAGGELQITDSMKFLVEEDKLFAYENKGKKYDIGDKIEYIKANIHFAMKHKEVNLEIRKYIKKILRQ